MYERLGSIQARGAGPTGVPERLRRPPFPAFIHVRLYAATGADAPNCSRVLTRRFRRVSDFPALRAGALGQYGTSVGGVKGEGSPGAASICPANTHVFTHECAKHLLACITLALLAHNGLT